MSRVVPNKIYISMKSRICLVLLIVFSFGTAAGQPHTGRHLKELVRMMAGEFSSEEQAARDTSYYSILLRMKPVWQEDPDGYWLYVEQSQASQQDKPYRQRVYHLTLESDTSISSTVFEIRGARNFTGAWKDKALLSQLRRDSLIEKDGCMIRLKWTGRGSYTGSTSGTSCRSSLRGAEYATSDVRITKGMILSWDRGWNREMKQVWGPENGGYQFRKKRNLK